ncbi:hypothetical protein NL676_008657 [Syzygium grande]|nr:hypothetical protein NL676_008657 [Syzygium grande]
MQLAIDQATLALDSLEVLVGCVIIEDGNIIAAGRNRTNETRNATRHAEMEALDFLLVMGYSGFSFDLRALILPIESSYAFAQLEFHQGT